jgi:hypothetical protein
MNRTYNTAVKPVAWVLKMRGLTLILSFVPWHLSFVIHVHKCELAGCSNLKMSWLFPPISFPSQYQFKFYKPSILYKPMSWCSSYLLYNLGYYADSSVSIVTEIDSKWQAFNSRQEQGLVSWSSRRDSLWGAPIPEPLSVQCICLFLTANRRGHVGSLSLPSGGEIKNAW